MSPTAKTVLIVALGLAVVLLGWGSLYAAVWASGGMLTVSVDPGPEGGRFYVAVPMALADAAAVGTRAFHHGDALRLEAHLGQWQPLVEAVLEGLDEAPDATLVEVIDGHDHVRVLKRGGSIRVEVDDAEVSVRVSIPVRGLARTARRLV